MERYKFKTLRIMRLIIATLAATAFVVVSVGCPDKNRNNNDDYFNRFGGFGGLPGYNGGFFGTQNLVREAVGSSPQGLQLGLSFYSPTGMAGFGGNYSGPISAQGIMYVQGSGFSFSGCAMPGGEYQVFSQSPGVWSGNQVDGLQLMGISPQGYQIQLVLGSAGTIVGNFTDLSGYPYQFSLYGQVQIVSINGCPGSVLNSYYIN